MEGMLRIKDTLKNTELNFVFDTFMRPGATAGFTSLKTIAGNSLCS